MLEAIVPETPDRLWALASRPVARVARVTVSALLGAWRRVRVFERLRAVDDRRDDEVGVFLSLRGPHLAVSARHVWASLWLAGCRRRRPPRAGKGRGP